MMQVTHSTRRGRYYICLNFEPSRSLQVRYDSVAAGMAATTPGMNTQHRRTKRPQKLIGGELHLVTVIAVENIIV
jgi:hypothetical protein